MEFVHRNIEELMAIAEALRNASHTAEDGEDEQIQALIRRQYSHSKEHAILRQHAMGTLSDEEWREYCEYVEKCIAEAREGTEE